MSNDNADTDSTLLRRAVEETTRLLDGLTEAQRARPTPCPAFTVGQLAEHLVGGAQMMATALDPSGTATDSSWKAVSQRLVTAAEAPVDGGTPTTLPYGEFPRSVVIQHALGEIAIHTCDIAKATGRPLVDDAVYERVFDVITDDWRVEGVLAAARPCDDGAPLIDRVLAFAGRTV
jgi:uncharacterized protein (TIGR03086 family)